MNVAGKIDQAIALEVSLKDIKKRLETVKAELQSELYADMLNKNLKWMQESATTGLCNVTLKDKLEVDSLEQLTRLLGDVAESKITRKESIDYEVESDFKKALIALYKEDYAAGDMATMLQQLGLDEKQIKLAQKKLCGDYAKDQKLLHSFGLSGALEEELDLIHGQKNYELVSRYFDLEQVDETFLKRLRLAVSVEDSISIGLVALEG